MTGAAAGAVTRDRRPGRLLGPAAVAVALAAADTYVVVLALPDMMTSVGLSIDQLQRAAPIVSGFLLGYVAMLPLVGRLADLRGRLPVLVGSLVVFALGSLVTAAAYDLSSLVAGRFLQGVGGGGLVPATLALVADLYPAGRRSLPLGLVSGVQELGSVLGPLYGAVVLALARWQDIFWVNLVVGLVLAAALSARRPAGPRARVDVVGAVLGLVAVLALLLVLLQPPGLVTGVTTGLPFVPFVGASRWLTPLGVLLALVAVAFVVRCLTAPHPLVDLRRWRGLVGQVDLPGAVLLALVLGGVVLAFATADPAVQLLSPAGPWLLAGSGVALVGLVVHHRRARAPLVPRGTFGARGAWGAVLVSFFVGAALVAVLVDVPIFARVTAYPDSQLLAALVLVRFLVAVPVGAVLGGAAARRLPDGLVATLGMALAAAGLWWMSAWSQDALASPLATVLLVGAGLGFGLALAPVNHALLAATDAAVHGVASSFVVVARMVGMLVGLSALTTLGLRRYYAVQADLPAPARVCHGGTRCPAYTDLLTGAGIAQLEVVFVGAACCAAVAGLLALILLRRPGAR